MNLFKKLFGKKKPATVQIPVQETRDPIAMRKYYTGRIVRLVKITDRKLKDLTIPNFEEPEQIYPSAEFFKWQEVLECNIIEVENAEKIICERCYLELLDNRNEAPTSPDVTIEMAAEALSEAERNECNKHLVWVNYRTAKIHWSNLAGREGYLSICTKHGIQVKFKMTSLS